ncbi:carbohydrate kinase family protein [Pseudoalteromonas sp. ZZD1]|uniref:carbohydrate kinase family protein n=1 Tax=Pseudoalteromonas sp. ZZD1 TaxID=3139395 RepID=UPI003BAD0883
MNKLLSYGELLIDMLPHDNRNSAYSPIPGGAPANVAVGYAKLGGSATFCGGMGDDNFAKLLTNSLIEYNVGTDYLFTIKDAQTAMVIVSLDEQAERSFNFYRHKTADLLINEQHLEKIEWKDFSVLHFCSNTLTDSHAANATVTALEHACQHDLLISFDVNLRYSLWKTPDQIENVVARCYGLCDIIKLSRDELQFLANKKGVTPHCYLEELLTLGVKLIFVTDGPNPAKAISRTFSIEQNAPEITALDTTSAGDAFIAGVLFYFHHFNSNTPVNEQIINEQIVAQAMAFGLRCGSKACLKKGAFPALPYLEDVLTNKLN